VRILLTNDDGIDSPGILALATALSGDGHEVVVAAPVTQTSGSGTSLGAELDGRRRSVTRTRLAELPGLAAYAVDATPAFITLAATSGWLGPRPDVVVSGVNSGHNLGCLSLFSGTLSAALTASIHGIPGVAVSALAGSDSQADAAARYVSAHLDRLVGDLVDGQAWNINYPDTTRAQGAPTWHEAVLAPMLPSEIVVDGDEASVGVSLGRDRRSDVESSDIALLARGHVTATRVSGVLDGSRQAH
jgi:5'-nucleotidase